MAARIVVKCYQCVAASVLLSQAVDLFRNNDFSLSFRSRLTLNALTTVPREARSQEDSNENDDSNEPEPVYESSKELNAWRRAVLNATNMSQLACCLLRLQSSIAWEKSIMKVVSIFRAIMNGCTL